MFKLPESLLDASESAHSRKIFFSFVPTQLGGTTDLLIQFSCWYKLGLSLGLTYAHQSFSCERSDARVFEYLGFERLWNEQPLHDFDQVLEIPLSKKEYCFPFTIRSFGLGFRLYVRLKIKAALKDVTKGERVLIRFRLAGAEDRELFHLMNRPLNYFKDGLNLNAAYWEHRKTHPVEDVFDQGATRILAHIRLGDATVIPSPWETFFTVFSTSVAEFKSEKADDIVPMDARERRALQSMAPYVSPDAFYRYLKSIETEDSGKHSIFLSSDGYNRTIEALCNSQDELALSDSQIDDLKSLCAEKNQQLEGLFSGVHGIALSIGESHERLCQLIHAALTADVIITSTQQLMIVKLLQLYGRTHNPPVLVILKSEQTAVAKIDIEKILEGRIVRLDVVNVGEI